MEGGQGRTSVTNWPGGEVERRSGGRAPERLVHFIYKQRKRWWWKNPGGGFVQKYLGGRGGCETDCQVVVVVLGGGI